MGTEHVVYISSHAIQLIKGSCEQDDVIKVQSCTEVALDENAIINGVITDEQQVTKGLQTLAASGVRSCRLVIDSGQILMKNIEIPMLKKREIKDVVKHALSDIDSSYEDLMYDYSVLSTRLENKRNKAEILCCGMERKLLASYVEVFENAGIRLLSVDVSVNALLKLTQELNDFINKTYIVSVVDANNVSSYLFIENHYVFSKRARLFSERGSDAFITEMISTVSQLMQFGKSNYSIPVSYAYFCGLNEQENAVVNESVRSNLHIEAGVFPNAKLISLMDKEERKKFQLHACVYAVGALIRK